MSGSENLIHPHVSRHAWWRTWRQPLPGGTSLRGLSTLAVAMACLTAASGVADDTADQPSPARPGATAPEPLPAPAGDDGASADDARKVIEEALARSAEAARAVEAEAKPDADTPVTLGPRRESPTTQPPSDLLVAKLSAQVAAGQLESKRLARTSPAEAFDRLDQLTTLVEAEAIPEEARLQILRRIERTRRELEEMTGKRRGELALERRNAAIEAEIEREQTMKTENEVRLAALVDQYNDLVDERRFEEAEAIAKKASELAPDNPVSRQLLAQSRIIRRLAAQQSIADAQASGFLDVTEDVEMSAAGFVGPISFPNTKDWEELTKNRSRLAAEGRGRLTADEQEIQRKLSTKVEASYNAKPLAEVIEELGKQAGVPIHIDMAGLEQEAVTTDTPVTLSIDQPISLKSALRLTLDPLNLDFTIRDEVLKITSPRMVQGEFYSTTYPVADLVIPVPNFSSDGLGITGALREGYSRVNLRNSLSVQTGPPPAGINAAAGSDGSVNGGNLAQFQPLGGNASASGSMPTIPFGASSGGGAQADFASLINLIQQTVAPTTWNTVGGQGAIQPFDTNLSLVVSQTQEVHEEIVDLLDQLRRLQDLQVTIEVRFISLNDTFFERIGVDFDFNIQSGVSEPLNITAVPTTSGSTYPENLGLTARPGGPTQTIGLDPGGNPGVSLSRNPGNQSPNYFSLPFRQNSFGAGGVPSLPGLPDPATSAANFGFAILSDIEAYFLIQAAQGNTRSNVMQAPKVTLFNGQQAFVSDTRQRPFVTSVVPVVGDFAAAQQPVITVLSEGTAVNVQAVVSNDRRFVRLTLVPFFSQIGNVQEFTFEGERSTKSKSSDEKTGPDANGGNVGPIPLAAGLNFGSAQSSELEISSNGTTIQQPEFLFTTVTTTVSVPDGGTVLLGGIKRLREGRNEFGVPILSKVPYINRLFKNVGLGRTTDSLMLMVTPRIIIQEEEEDKLLGVRAP
ncbi:MAG: general secretion pathway protein GspD [Pirellulales bacterium]|nr:general secretion pathway protein GspD [Pirellulales bacterium]